MPPSRIHPHSMDNSTLLSWPEALECHPHPPLSSQFSMQLGHTLKASFTYLPIPIPILITQCLDYCNDLKAHSPAPLFPFKVYENYLLQTLNFNYHHDSLLKHL